MKKKAIIITGQLRTNELTKWFHKNSFIDNDNFDIFLSIDPNNQTQLLYQNDIETTNNDVIDNIIKFYNPKDYYIGINDDDNLIYNKYMDLYNKQFIYYDDNHDTIDIKQEEINLFLIGKKEQYMDKTINICNLSLNKGIIKNGCLTENSVKGLFRQFYFVNKGYEILNNYKIKNNITYDIVIRIRFDHIIFNDNFINNDLSKFKTFNNTIIYSKDNIIKAQNLSNLNLEYDSININTINVMGAGVYNKYVYVNDFFWTHGSDLIDKMLNFYDQLHNIILFTMNNFFPIYGAGIEHYFAIFLFNNHIKIQQTIMNKCNIIRQK